MNVSDFDFPLPPELIAQAPAPERSDSRLLVLGRRTGRVQHAAMRELPEFLEPGDLLVVNNTRVFPARLLGERLADPSGSASRSPPAGPVECLLLGRLEGDVWDALMRPAQRLKAGAVVRFPRGRARLFGEVLECRPFGRRMVRLWTDADAGVDAVIETIGHVPLPPYIKRGDHKEDRERYQTVYARVRGSVAAPTAGLHFSEELFRALGARGVGRAEITLHVGYGTFKPVRVDTVQEHTVDPEPFSIEQPTADAINRALDEGRRVIAVGTTTTRALETAARLGHERVAAASGVTSLFIHPGFEFSIIRGLLTNFHLPRSSLLMLVCAFAGRTQVLDAYREAVERRYRFYSYGDTMLIL